MQWLSLFLLRELVSTLKVTFIDTFLTTIYTYTMVVGASLTIPLEAPPRADCRSSLQVFTLQEAKSVQGKVALLLSILMVAGTDVGWYC